MRVHRDSLAFTKSLVIHGCLIAALLTLVHRNKPEVETIFSDKLEVELAKPRPKRVAKASTGKKQKSNLDFLSPSFIKDGTLFAKKDDGKDNVTGVQGTDEIVHTTFKVKTAFDHLALQINRNLDYSPMLIENNIQGTAHLDLHFDDDGNVDEVKSLFSGSHHLVRGLLVQATRLGLVEWYRSDAYRLKRNDFRGQHFRLVINVNTLADNASDVTKIGNDSYLLRREQMASLKACMVPGSLDVVCLVKKVEGLFTGDVARSRFQELKAKLEHWDEVGLRGIGGEIRG